MNKLINKFCNLLMRSGNKTKARALLMQGFTLFLLADHGLRQNSTKHLQGVAAQPSPWAESKDSDESLLPVKRVSTRSDKFLIFKPSVATGACRELTPFRYTKIGLATHPEGSQEKRNKIVPESILDALIENVRPCIEIRKVRAARATYQVPAQIGKSKGQTLALRWIIEFANKAKVSNKISFPEALAEQLKLAFRKQGPVRERRSQLHRLAEANRSYMRYRWW